VSLASLNSVQGKTHAIPLLIPAAVGACLFTSSAGWLHYSASNKLNESRDWIEHSQVVMANLQSETQRLDRIGTAVRLYQLTHDEADVRDAQANQIAFASGAMRLQELVADNQRQSLEARQLQACGEALDKVIIELSAQKDEVSHSVLQCRQSVARLREVESELINQRTDDLRLYSARNIIMSVAATALSISMILTLFAFLLRDAIRRKRYEQRLFDANEKLAGTVRALERQAKEAALLTSVRDELHLCIRPAQAQECVARYFEQMLPGTSGSLNLINQSHHLVETAASWGSSRLMMEGFAVEGCSGLRSGRMRWRRPMQSEVHCSHFAGTPPEHYVCIPLAAYGDTLGFVCIECLSPGLAAMVDANMAPLQELIELTSISLASLNLRSRLEQQSIRDALTGLFNRHFMEIALEREIQRSVRHDKPVAIMMLDIDHFKQFNDTFGHEAGDTVLRELGEVLLQSVRNEDILCRFGGEEFVAILPETALDAALERAEALRRLVRELKVRHRGESLCEITMSIGVAVFPQHAETPAEIMRAADRALYEAKHLGRNRVVLAESALLA
jgi:diguanylate cyclase (GGDEF)-like protein